MGNLYLVRHGQASFGADDYDMLSDLGVRQSVRLGQYFALRKLKFDAVITGGLRRHAQTWAAIAQGGGVQADALVWPGLNEYDSEAVIRATHPFPLEKVQSPEDYRAHFRLLRDGLRQWMNGVISPVGMPTYPEFVQGVTSALDHVRSQCSGNVLIVSSGGPISTAVGHLLGTMPETTVELNFRIRNSSVTELAFTPKRHMLVTYNTLPHLDEPEYASWITYA
jgi:broad specificity phosphatase PhoE